MSNEVLKLENISKYYKLGQFNNGTFFKDMQSALAVKRGKADPNAKLDSRNNNEDGFWALKDISFSVEQGERVGIIGKNGAGKSTLLKLISEITAPTNGRIYINGRVASLLEVGTGFHPEMTGRENIYLNGSILGMKRSEINAKINDIIEFSEIEEHIDTPVKRYSSGMYVRLAFAVAAHLDSDILIADEVLAVGDADFQKKALGKMNSISTQQGRTVLFVSHNMSAVRNLCNKGILLDSGKITKQGDIDDVIDTYFENPFLNVNEGITDKIRKLPEDETFQLLNIEVTQKNKAIDQFAGNGDPIDISVSYRVNKSERGLRVYFDIYDTVGNLLFRSFNDEDNDSMSYVEEGEYISRVSIPANVLAPNKYILVVYSTIYNVRACMGDGIKIPLNIIQNGIYNRAYPNDPCRGKLAIHLKWDNIRK